MSTCLCVSAVFGLRLTFLTRTTKKMQQGDNNRNDDPILELWDMEDDDLFPGLDDLDDVDIPERLHLVCSLFVLLLDRIDQEVLKVLHRCLLFSRRTFLFAKRTSTQRTESCFSSTATSTAWKPRAFLSSHRPVSN